TATPKRQVYIRRSAEKRKDKGKAIVQEDEPVQKKFKKQLEQERLGYEEAIRLQEQQEQIDKDERQRIARDAEIAKQLQEEIDKARQEKVVAEADIAYVIDWSDLAVIRYFKEMSYEDIRPIFEKVWDQIHSFVPMESDISVLKKTSGISKRNAEEELIQDNSKKQKTEESFVPVEESELVKLSQEEIQEMMIVVPDEGMRVEALQTKYPIIDWEVYSEDNMQFWKIIKVGDHTEDLGLTEDKEKELWVEMKMLFDPNEKDLLELQRHMHDLLKWRLYDTCAIHHVSTEKGQDIFMLVEKDYPLTRGLMMLMLVNKLLVEEHSKMADELVTKIFTLANACTVG
ncbi:hypothetical protein Tco_1049141, partial [Tanacetum coccineum]